MNTCDKSRLIDEITRQVMHYLKDKSDEKEISEIRSVLVLGDGSYPDDAVIFKLDDFERYSDIKKYESVFLSSLTLWQLTDIAQCRDSTPFCRAVLKALMNDVPVYIERRTLDVLTCEKINPTINKKINENINTILSYQVMLYGENEKKTPRPKQKSNEIGRGLITEEEARKMCGNSETRIALSKGTIMTPLAKDYFLYKGVTVDYE